MFFKKIDKKRIHISNHIVRLHSLPKGYSAHVGFNLKHSFRTYLC